MYVYVSKREYAPYRRELDEIVRQVQRIMRKKYKTTFQPRLIGSAGRHLVTKIKNGNKGYDFDYNLILQKTPLCNDPKKLKRQFMDAFNEAVQGTSYSPPEDSTSAITIKVIDKKNSKIIRSCDFAIIDYLNDKEPNRGYRYLKNLKNGTYEFCVRNQSINFSAKLDVIKEYDDGWNMVREEYIKLKNKNKDSNKKSFILYLESVNNVYNQLLDFELSGLV